MSRLYVFYLSLSPFTSAILLLSNGKRGESESLKVEKKRKKWRVAGNKKPYEPAYALIRCTPQMHDSVVFDAYTLDEKKREKEKVEGKREREKKFHRKVGKKLGGGGIGEGGREKGSYPPQVSLLSQFPPSLSPSFPCSAFLYFTPNST